MVAQYHYISSHYFDDAIVNHVLKDVYTPYTSKFLKHPVDRLGSMAYQLQYFHLLQPDVFLWLLFLKFLFLWIQFGDEYTTGINMYLVHIPDAEVVLSASEDVVVVSEPRA